MKKKLQMIVWTTLIFTLPSCDTRSYLDSQDGLEVLHLEGSPFERGVAHGKFLREEIHQTIDRWIREVEEQFHADFHTVLAEFLESTSYQAWLKELDPDLLDEVFGMAESSGVAYGTLLAFQMSEEMMTVLEGEVRNCTVLGFCGSDSSHTLLAQNMDPPLFLHGHPFVMHVVPGNGGAEQYIFTVPGHLGLAGMNDRGIAVTCNSISMLNHDTTGLPVVSVVRQLLSRTRLEDAVSFLKEISFTLPQCYTLGGPEGLRCFECSAGAMAEFYPFENRNIVLHTNYSIHNRDFNQGFIDLLAAYGKTIDDPYYCPRYFLAYDEIEDRNRHLSIRDMQDILRLEKPEIEPILNDYTLGTLVMKLDDDPALFLALGHEKEARFHRLGFK